MKNKKDKSKAEKMKALPPNNPVRKNYEAVAPEIKRAIEVMKQQGFYCDELEDCGTHRQVLFIYHYVVNLINGKKSATDAARKAGYKSPALAGARLMHHPNVASAITTLLTQNDFFTHDIITDLNNMRKTDLADYEEVLDGSKTLAQLREEGVDTSLIDSLETGTDRNGNPYTKIRKTKRIEATNAMLKALLQLRNVKQETNEKEQQTNIIVVSNVPSHRDRALEYKDPNENDENDNKEDEAYIDVEFEEGGKDGEEDETR